MKFIQAFVLSLVLFLSACTTVEETNRRALHIVSQEQLNQMSKEEFERLKKESQLSNNSDYHERIQTVIRDLSEVISLDSNQYNFQWDYILIEDDEIVNAFALPGGQIGIYTGLFKVALTKSDLAVVIGHEMAHVIARHGGERMSQQLLAYGGSFLLSIRSEDTSPERQRQLMTAYGLGSKLGFLLPYSRVHEKEADRLGLYYMTKAGYDPRVAIAFWQRMSEEKSIVLPELLSTHPSDHNRIAHLKLILEELGFSYE